MKYKVGDKVRVKSIEWYNSNKTKSGSVKCGSDTFIGEMSTMCGKEVTISKVYPSCDKYRIEEYDCNWTDEMFEDFSFIINCEEDDLLL